MVEELKSYIKELVKKKKYLSSREIIELIVPFELNEEEFDELLESIGRELLSFTLQNGEGYIVWNDKQSINTFIDKVEISKNDNIWFDIRREYSNCKK